MIKWLANKFGYFVVPINEVLGWSIEGRAHLKVAQDYDESDPRLSGINDGRAESLLKVCQEIREYNQ